MLYPTIGVPLMGTGILRRYEQYLYTHCLQRAGASVQVLALHAFSGAGDAALKQCDGFPLPGGPDIRPELYGQDRLPACREPNLSTLTLTAFWPGFWIQIPFLSTACTIRLSMNRAKDSGSRQTARRGSQKHWR